MGQHTHMHPQTQYYNTSNMHNYYTMYTHTYTCTHTYTHTPAHTHTHTHTPVHTHAHAHNHKLYYHSCAVYNPRSKHHTDIYGVTMNHADLITTYIIV